MHWDGEKVNKMGDAVKLTGYEMGGLLGQGTQGCVYKATTRGPERKPVAIKVELFELPDLNLVFDHKKFKSWMGMNE